MSLLGESRGESVGVTEYFSLKREIFILTPDGLSSSFFPYKQESNRAKTMMRNRSAKTGSDADLFEVKVATSRLFRLISVSLLLLAVFVTISRLFLVLLFLLLFGFS